MRPPTTVGRLEDLAVDEFDLASRRQGHHQPGNAVDDQARLAFALAQRVLGALQIVDVVDRSVPIDNPALAVTERLPNGPNPSMLPSARRSL